MDRLFLDANVLFSAAYKPDARVFLLWKLDNVLLWSSRYAFEEARRNLDSEIQQHRLLKLAAKLQFVEASDSVSASSKVNLPEKDTPILLAAVEAGADYLLTGDSTHFGAYFGKKLMGVVVMAPGPYLRLHGR
jgi:predicted nucleic acid-binding protein